MGFPSMKKNTFWTIILLGCLVIAVSIGLSTLIISERNQRDNPDIQVGNAAEAPGEAAAGTAEERVQPPANPVTVVKKRIKGMSAKNIKRNLKYLSKITHVAGTDGSEELGDWIHGKWRRGGFDKVEKKGYDALLSYPSRKPGEINKMEIVDMDEERDEYVTVYESTPEELDPTVANDDVMPAYSAYAKPGVVTGDLVFVSHCRIDDFIQLRYANVSVEGNIAICRDGRLFRGDMAKNAARFGCAGLLFYTEPDKLAQLWREPSYPDGVYLPDTAIKRGSLSPRNGDLQTPGYPSLEGMYRTPVEELDLPTIPVHPISERDARALMMRMDGPEVEHWKGLNLPNVTYRYGPGFVNKTEKVRISVYNKLEVRKVYNIIGTIYGRSEPDRYVLIGNHRDAWAYGAIDPSGSTAIMLEIAEVFGLLNKKMNWRPRRTLMFCSWAAEEFGLIGSNEFMEDYGRIMSPRAVAYLNMEILVQGNYTIAAASSPNMREAMFEAARMVPDPDGSDMSFYDIWRDRQLYRVPGSNLPYVDTLGGGSDYASFVGQCGISSMNAIYMPNPYLAMYSVYPLYHTRYETFHLVKTLMDPDFIYHKAMGQFYGFLLLIMSNSKILPFNCRDYAEDLANQFENLNETYGAAFAKQDIDLSPLVAVIDDLKEATKEFHKRLDFIDTSQPLEVRRTNDQLMMFERAFVDPVGLPNRPFTRNVIYSFSERNRYSSEKFPGIVDTMYQLINSDNPDLTLWKTVEQLDFPRPPLLGGNVGYIYFRTS